MCDTIQKRKKLFVAKSYCVAVGCVTWSVINDFKKYQGDLFRFDAPREVEYHKTSHVHNIKVVADKRFLGKHLNLDDIATMILTFTNSICYLSILIAKQLQVCELDHCGQLLMEKKDSVAPRTVVTVYVSHNRLVKLL